MLRSSFPFVVLALAACGGAPGGGNPAPTTPPPAAQALTLTYFTMAG